MIWTKKIKTFCNDITSINAESRTVDNEVPTTIAKPLSVSNYRLFLRNSTLLLEILLVMNFQLLKCNVYFSGSKADEEG